MGVKITQPFSFDSQKPNFERDTINSNTLFSSHSPLDLNEVERLALAANYDVGHIVWDTHTNKYYSVQVDATSGCKLENIIQTVRTMNGEQLTDSTLGDINIHDGFYFPNAVSDYDGNWYGAVVIGDQVWLAENLRTTHYADGTIINEGGENISSTTIPYYYNYPLSSIPLEKSGLLYNWPAVMKGSSSSDTNPSGVQGISPIGWHIPSKTEWQQLFTYVNKQKRYRYNDENDKISKSLAYNDYWRTNGTEGSTGNNESSNNSTGFSIIPAGKYESSSFSSIRNSACFYTSTLAAGNYYIFYAGLSYYTATAEIYNYKSDCGRSVRCVSDLSPVQFRNWYVRQYGSLQHHLPQEIPPQAQADWDASDSDPSAILNKPDLAAVATSGDYGDLLNKPTIPTVRTMNGEQLTDSTLGDINIHDGFVFPNAVKDTEGYWYDAVVIGNQVWMTENLRTKYIHLNGSNQPTEIEEQASGSSSTFPADAMRCYKVSGSTAGFNKYGYLYNWMAATGITSGPVPEGFVRGVSPSGWHIPSLTEFDELVNYCKKQDRYPDKKCLATNKKNYWDTNSTPNSTFVGINLDQNNTTGFNAYPNGAYFGSNETNQNRKATYRFTCWLATESVNHPGCSRTVGMGYTNGALWPTYGDTGPDNGGDAVDKKKFIGVRCISDMNPTQFRAWYVNEYGSMQHHLPQEIQTLHIGPHDYDGSAEVFVDIYDSDYYFSSDYNGGGGATTLAELLDTNITPPQNGQILVYNNGMWGNVSKDTLVCYTTGQSSFNQETGYVEYTLDHTFSEISNAVNNGKDVILVVGGGNIGYVYRLSFWRIGYNIIDFVCYDGGLGDGSCVHTIGYNQDSSMLSSLNGKWVHRQYEYKETGIFFRNNSCTQISINLNSVVDRRITFSATIICVDTLGSASTITFTSGTSGSTVYLRNATDTNLSSNGTKVLKISRIGGDYYVESWEPTTSLTPSNEGGDGPVQYEHNEEE